MMETIPLVRESEASDDRVKEAFRDVKELLRVSVVSVVFQAYAAVPRFLDYAWRRLRPNMLTPPFVERSKKIGLLAEQGIGAWRVHDHAADLLARNVSETEIRRMRELCALFFQTNPKLLVIANAVRLALAGEVVGGVGSAGLPQEYDKEKLARDFRGVAVQLVEEKEAPLRVRTAYEELKRASGLPFVPTDYRAMGAHPDWLELWWRDCKPLLVDERYRALCERIAEEATDAARHLPYLLDLSAESLERHGVDAQARLSIGGRNQTFCHFLPGLVVNIAVARRGLGPE